MSFNLHAHLGHVIRHLLLWSLNYLHFSLKGTPFQETCKTDFGQDSHDVPTGEWYQISWSPSCGWTICTFTRTTVFKQCTEITTTNKTTIKLQKVPARNHPDNNTLNRNISTFSKRRWSALFLYELPPLDHSPTIMLLQIHRMYSARVHMLNSSDKTIYQLGPSKVLYFWHFALI